MKAKNSVWMILSALACFGFGVLVGRGTQTRSVGKSKAASGAQLLFAPASASVAQQKMCDEQAAKKFHEILGGNTSLSSYTSRYDPSENVCYVRVFYIGSAGKSAVATDTVYDAFGGRVFAAYGSIGTQDPPTMCKIFIPGKPVRVCKSTQEFNELVEKCFGVAE